MNKQEKSVLLDAACELEQAAQRVRRTIADEVTEEERKQHEKSISDPPLEGLAGGK